MQSGAGQFVFLRCQDSLVFFPHLLQSGVECKVVALQLLDLPSVELSNAGQLGHVLLQKLNRPRQVALWVAVLDWSGCAVLRGKLGGLPGREGLGRLHRGRLQSMSRVRQFGGLRQSRSSRQGSSGHFGQTVTLGRASPHGHYMCVTCVNRSMSQQRALLRTSQRRQENSQVLECERRDQELRNTEARARRAEEERRKVLEYNQEAMRTWEERRQRQKVQKEQDRKLEQLSSTQYEKKIQQERRRQALLREKWRKDIDQQVSLKQERLTNEKQEIRAAPVAKQTQREEQVARAQAERLEKYRNDLLVQIKEGQARKERQKLEKGKDYDVAGCSILDRAEERARRVKQLDRDRRSQLEDEKRRYQQKLERKRWEEQQRAEKERALDRTAKEREEQQARQAERRRESQIQNYLSQIKQQISEKEKTRRNEQMRERAVTNESFLKERPVDARTCDSCERPFPKAYLTLVQEE